jgi:hypothetical protein
MIGKQCIILIISIKYIIEGRLPQVHNSKRCRHLTRAAF